MISYKKNDLCNKKIDIQGVEVFISNPPDKINILFSHYPKKEQYWRRTELPFFKASDIDWFSGDEPQNPDEIIDWETVRREEFIKQTGTDPFDVDKQGNPKQVRGIDIDPDYISEVLEDFRKQELNKIYNGVWFMNNGTPTYLTGFYYFYLNWWKLDVGYASFRIPDLELFYLLEVCYQNPNSFGLIYITVRGCGKSVIAGAWAYYMTITHEKSHIGIQSKTDDDAEALFKNKIAEPYKDLPDFLIPINRNGTNPTKSLDFSPPSKTGKNSYIHRALQKKALRSILTYRNAQEKAYDGETLKGILQDEVGKVEKKIANVYRRWMVNRQCLYRDGKKRGTAFLTTTVEEMDKGGEECKKIWDESDQLSKNENDRTTSWLYRYFRSALDASNFDIYGYPDVLANKTYHDAERKSLEHDPTSLVSYIQKNPYTIEEAFMTMGGECLYNAAILQRKQLHLTTDEFRRKIVSRGDFTWVDGVKDTKVEFVRNEVNGMWEVTWMDINENERNQLYPIGEFDGVIQWGVQMSKRVIGYDPYSARKVIDNKKKSDAAMAVFQPYDFHIKDADEYTETFIADFSGRYPNPDDAHEQCIMASVFFGASVLVENNRKGAIEYMIRRGYSSILMNRPSASGNHHDNYENYIGYPSTTASIDYYVQITRTHIQNHGEKLKHLRIVKDWLDFDATKTTKYDSGVAASLALVAAKKPLENFNNDALDLGNFFPS